MKNEFGFHEYPKDSKWEPQQKSPDHGRGIFVGVPRTGYVKLGT